MLQGIQFLFFNFERITKKDTNNYVVCVVVQSVYTSLIVLQNSYFFCILTDQFSTQVFAGFFTMMALYLTQFFEYSFAVPDTVTYDVMFLIVFFIISLSMVFVRGYGIHNFLN